MDAKVAKIRTHFQSLTKLEKEVYLRGLNYDQMRWHYKHPEIFLFDKQIIPEGTWMYYLLRCGRSFGKTFTGAAWVATKIRDGAKIIGLCGPTYDDVAKVMVPAILAWFMADELEEVPYNHQTHTVSFRNGAKIYCYTSEKEIRGPNLEYLWCDEICAWAGGMPEKIKEHFEDITRAVRVGKHPQTIITSTPKTHPFFIHFQDQIDGYNSNYKMVQGSILDNPTLPKEYVDEQIKTYGTGARGRQELFGDLILDTLGAFWTHKLIDDARAPLPSQYKARPRNKLPTNAELNGQAPMPPPIPPDAIYLVRTLIGFDPAGSVNGDECGIIVGSLYSNNQAYIIADYSDHMGPAQYVNLVNKMYVQHEAAGVVVESNFGGKESFNFMFRTVNANMNIIPRNVSTGKTTRAEHIASLYNQGKVHHVASLKLLEDQMCAFNVHFSKSPDRVDALGLLLTELFWPTSPVSTNTYRNLPQR